MRLGYLLPLALGLVSLTASASTITDILDVSATVNGTQTVDLSYSLTFDPTQNYLNPITTGLTLLSASSSDPTYEAAFQKTPSWDYFFAPNGTFTIGPVDPRFGIPGAVIGSYGYLIQIALNASDISNPDGRFTILAEASPSSVAQTFTGTVKVTQVGAPSAVTPEPGSLSLFGTGLLALSGAARRRYKRRLLGV